MVEKNLIKSKYRYPGSFSTTEFKLLSKLSLSQVLQKWYYCCNSFPLSAKIHFLWILTIGVACQINRLSKPQSEKCPWYLFFLSRLVFQFVLLYDPHLFDRVGGGERIGSKTEKIRKCGSARQPRGNFSKGGGENQWFGFCQDFNGSGSWFQFFL